jgi:hypothetical protein
MTDDESNEIIESTQNEQLSFNIFSLSDQNDSTSDSKIKHEISLNDSLNEVAKKGRNDSQTIS